MRSHDTFQTILISGTVKSSGTLSDLQVEFDEISNKFSTNKNRCLKTSWDMNLKIGRKIASCGRTFRLTLTTIFLVSFIRTIWISITLPCIRYTFSPFTPKFIRVTDTLKHTYFVVNMIKFILQSSLEGHYN